jgi:hypothetical protein
MNDDERAAIIGRAERWLFAYRDGGPYKTISEYDRNIVRDLLSIAAAPTKDELGRCPGRDHGAQ